MLTVECRARLLNFNHPHPKNHVPYPYHTKKCIYLTIAICNGKMINGTMFVEDSFIWSYRTDKEDTQWIANWKSFIHYWITLEKYCITRGFKVQALCGSSTCVITLMTYFRNWIERITLCDWSGPQQSAVATGVLRSFPLRVQDDAQDVDGIIIECCCCKNTNTIDHTIAACQINWAKASPTLDPSFTRWWWLFVWDLVYPRWIFMVWGFKMTLGIPVVKHTWSTVCRDSRLQYPYP